MFRRLNQALPELLLGILLYGIVIQVTGVWFAQDRLRYSSGLWIGIATAMAMAYHIARIIAETIDCMDPHKAKVQITAKGILRLWRYSVLPCILILVTLLRFFWA